MTRRGVTRRGIHRERAQSTVELALTLPVLVVAVLVVVQLLVVARDAVALTAGARAAAREAIVGGDALAAARREPRLDPARLRVAVEGGDASGAFVTVTVTYRSPTGVPLVGRFVGDVELRERFVVRRE